MGVLQGFIFAPLAVSCRQYGAPGAQPGVFPTRQRCSPGVNKRAVLIVLALKFMMQQGKLQFDLGPCSMPTIGIPWTSGALYAPEEKLRVLESERLRLEALRDNPDLPLVYLDIAIKGNYVGRIKIVLFKNEAPRAAENFRALCTGGWASWVHVGVESTSGSLVCCCLQVVWAGQVHGRTATIPVARTAAHCAPWGPQLVDRSPTISFPQARRALCPKGTRVRGSRTTSRARPSIALSTGREGRDWYGPSAAVWRAFACAACMVPGTDREP